MNTKE